MQLSRFYRYTRLRCRNTRFMSKMSNSSLKNEKAGGTASTQEIVEGTARMLYDTKETVFYNKVQVLNRDLSIQVIKLFSEKITEERRLNYEKKLSRYEEHSAKAGGKETNKIPPPRIPKSDISILDALAASGLRSIRYLKEIPLAGSVTINDISEEANKLAHDNCIRNNVDLSKVQISLQDATAFMYQHRDPMQQFDVVDLDPYGSAATFLDAAVQAVVDGGLLCVTCTDMAVLSGNYPEVCFAKYNSMPVRGKYVHEMSLRILLHAIDQTANKYRRYIVPWLSLSVDFYVRVFVRVYESPQEVKNSCKRRGFLFQSQTTPDFTLHSMAESNKTGNYVATTLRSLPILDSSGVKMGGPFWFEEIHRQEVVDELLSRAIAFESKEEVEKQNYPIPTVKRMTGLLTVISEELKDVPFYYSLPELASTIKCGVPQQREFYSALHNLGYRVSQFHHEPTAIKTDAPAEVLWDIMRVYYKTHPPAESKNGLSAIAKAILDKPVTITVDFTTNLGTKGPDKSVPRFPPNPEANWGPKRKAGREKKESVKAEEEEEAKEPEEDNETKTDEERKEKRPRRDH